MIDDEARELLQRAARVCSDYINPRIEARERIANSQKLRRIANSQKLRDDISDYFVTQANEDSLPQAPREIDLVGLHDILAAIDRQTASNEAWNFAWLEMRIVENARSARINELWEQHAAREKEAFEQRQADRKADAEAQARVNKLPGRWFRVDGQPCRFEFTIDGKYFGVRGEDRVFHRILIEGAQECNAPISDRKDGSYIGQEHERCARKEAFDSE